MLEQICTCGLESFIITLYKKLHVTRKHILLLKTTLILLWDYILNIKCDGYDNDRIVRVSIVSCNFCPSTNKSLFACDVLYQRHSLSVSYILFLVHSLHFYWHLPQNWRLSYTAQFICFSLITFLFVITSKIIRHSLHPDIFNTSCSITFQMLSILSFQHFQLFNYKVTIRICNNLLLNLTFTLCEVSNVVLLWKAFCYIEVRKYWYIRFKNSLFLYRTRIFPNRHNQFHH